MTAIPTRKNASASRPLPPGEDPRDYVRTVDINGLIDALTGAGDALDGAEVQATGSTVARSLAARAADRLNCLDFGCVADNSTNNTAALLGMFTTLGAGWRGTVWIPYGVKFTVSTVYASVPVGVRLVDASEVNWYSSGGYRMGGRVVYSGDLEADDYSSMIASGHHPAIRFINTGSTGSDSALGRYMSMLYAAGIRWNGTAIDGMRQLVSKDPYTDRWRVAWVLDSTWLAASGKGQWTTGTSYVIGDVVDTDDDRVYQATTNGTAGVSKPVHTVGTASDGGVTWQYLGPWIVGGTRFAIYEDGDAAVFGDTTARLKLSGATTASLRADASGITLRDETGGRDVFDINAARGFTVNIATSPGWSTVSGATPSASTPALYVNNGGATDMTDLVLPGTQTYGQVLLLFANANTTLKYVGGHFVLKGAVDVTPPAGGVMQFIRYPTHTSDWIEVSRSW